MRIRWALTEGAMACALPIKKCGNSTNGRPSGYGRPAQSLDLHLSADAITKRLSDMTDAELAALEQRMIAAAPIVLEATAEVSDDAGERPDGDTDAAEDGGSHVDDEHPDDEAANT